ncbi:hypothetical protein JXD38_06490 [candidate division WOR-3 bacterium]|nr:hypothetical protein [candidate division WOR-3 bacterium]
MPDDSRVRAGPANALTYVAALVVLGLLAGCRLPTTVYGRLVLKPGEDGDVRLARVELHDTTAWDSTPLYETAPDTGDLYYRVSFEFPVVAPGPYYVRAWQDRDGDGKVSDGDLTGVCGGPHRPGWPGEPVIVYDRWTVDAGDIEMATYQVLEVNATGAMSQSRDTTTFAYSFNHDVLLSSLAVAFPGQPALPDPNAPGDKIADSTYLSGGWTMGDSMPSGLHQLEFRGMFRDSSFVLRAAVLVR